jgi:hypothetical protein
MPQTFIERAQSKFVFTSDSYSEFAKELQERLDPLSSVDDDTGLVLKGQLFVEEVCYEILSSFFNSAHAKSIIEGRFSFGAVNQLLRATNLISHSIYEALEILRVMRNGLAHQRYTLDDILKHPDEKIRNKYKKSCRDLKVSGVNRLSDKALFIPWLVKIYVELHKTCLVAQAINRYANRTTFIDELENIDLSKVFSDPQNIFSK